LLEVTITSHAAARFVRALRELEGGVGVPEIPPRDLLDAHAAVLEEMPRLNPRERSELVRLSLQIATSPGDPLQLAERTISTLGRLRRREDLSPEERARVSEVLASAFGQVGRREDAFELTKVAVDLYRRLAAVRPEVFHHVLAGSLTDLAARLYELGRRDEALSAIHEAVGLYRKLVMAQRDSLGDLARSLTVQSAVLSSLGRREEAASAINEAADIYRALVIDDPGTFRPDLAGALNNLSIMLAGLGRHVAALAAADEAVDIRRTLAKQSPAAYLPLLAKALNTRSIRLAEVGRPEEALAAIDEAVTLYRELTARHRDRFAPELATSLNTRSIRLAALGRREEALAAIDEVVELDRRLALERPGAFEPDLAGALHNLAARYTELGRDDEAATAVREAVGLYRRLASTEPEAFDHELAISLSTFSSVLSTLGRREEALTVIREAVERLRRLAAEHPGQFRRYLAMSLNAMSNRLSDLDSSTEALTAIDEAVGLYRSLAADSPETFRGRLATSLNNQSGVLLELGHADQAIAVIGEAVDIQRHLAARRPEAFTSDLATSLVTMLAVLERLGRADDALTVAAEVIALGAPLAQSAKALRRLLESPIERRPQNSTTVIADALRSATDQILAELGLVRSPQDRRRVLANTAWLVGAGAVFLADEANDSQSAVCWLVAASVAEATLVASTQGIEFALLKADRPDLADRLAAIITGRQSESLPASDDAGGHQRESLSTVLAEIRSLDGRKDFLRPPSFAAISSQLDHTTAWLVVGPHGAGLVHVGREGQCGWHRVEVTEQRMAELLNRSLPSRATDGAKLMLRTFVDDVVVPKLVAIDATDLEVIPVGICAWLPIQSRARTTGLRLRLRPALLAAQANPVRAGEPYVAHSDAVGPDRPLVFGKQEADYVGRLAGVRPDFDPDVTAERVLSAVDDSPLVHISCHGVAVAADPLQTCLLLGHDRLTVDQLGQRLGHARAPTFAALSACETARPEAIVPEQALGFPSVLLSHGTRAVLGTLWPVYDHIAHDMMTSFYELWAAGKTAGSAIAEALGAARPLSTSADAFCLQGDYDLRWPLMPHSDIQAPVPAHRLGALRYDPGEIMKVVSDLELAEYLDAARRYIPEDAVNPLATRVTAWLDDIEAGDLPPLAASRQALVQELERLGAGVQDSAKRELGASTAETGAVQHESPRPDPELIRRLREQYAPQRPR
jgi:tetratricopeptide (TPR) repeat protein/predicted transcriptional regulator